MRSFLILAMLIIGIILVSGCSSENKNEETALNETTAAAEPDADENNEMKTVSGNYTGQVDRSSIEIKLPGTDDNESYSVFRLTPDIEKKLGTYVLKKDDFITVDYKVDSNGSKVIYDIKKDAQSATSEENKKIEVKVEGSTEMREARLTTSDTNKYSFYLLDNFTFSPEEPGKDIIFSKYDDEFFVRIEILDSKADLDKLKEERKNAYSTMGKVTDVDPSTIFADKFKDSKLYLYIDILASKENRVQNSINYVVKDFDGRLYAFTFNMPLKEAAEGITPSLWAMVSTIENK